MKFSLLIVFLCCCGVVTAQNEPAGLQMPAENKSMVYIARQGGIGALVKFRIYDGDQFLGRLSAGRYFAYECEPGHHVFTARAENISFAEAELEAGRIYVIEAVPQVGIAFTRVALRPLEKGRKRYEKEKSRFLKFIGKAKGELLLTEGEPEDTESENGEETETGTIMERFNKRKENGGKITSVLPDMFLDL